MRKGNKLLCVNDILSFKKDKVYEILYVDNESININVYIKLNDENNEYVSFDVQWVLVNFIKL